MSWPNTWPRSSLLTLPMYAARPPKLATRTPCWRPNRRSSPRRSRARRTAPPPDRSRPASSSPSRARARPGTPRSTMRSRRPGRCRCRPRRTGRRPPFMIAGDRADQRRHLGHGPTRYRRYLSPCLTRPRSPTSIRSIRSGCPRSPGPPATTSGSLRRWPDATLRRHGHDPARRRARNATGWCSTPPN